MLVVTLSDGRYVRERDPPGLAGATFNSKIVPCTVLMVPRSAYPAPVRMVAGAKVGEYAPALHIYTSTNPSSTVHSPPPDDLAPYTNGTPKATSVYLIFSTV